MSITLNYGEHTVRLMRIDALTRFTTKAVVKIQRAVVGQPKRPFFHVDPVTGLLQSDAESRPKLPELKSRKDIDDFLLGSGQSNELLCSLGLVMLVTLTEIFVEHLIDVILQAEPRRLKDLAGQKILTAAEIVDLHDYGLVMRCLREKVSKEVVASSPHDMLVKHLGERFGLFNKDKISYKIITPHGVKERGLTDIEYTWGNQAFDCSRRALQCYRGLL